MKNEKGCRRKLLKTIQTEVAKFDSDRKKIYLVPNKSFRYNNL